MPGRILGRRFYARDPRIVAKQLLGRRLVSTYGGKRASGIIVETEAYLSSGDSACHGFVGKKNKNAIMFGPAGIAYVYPIHAKFCFNVVTEQADKPSAVLIRALQPSENIAQMELRRRQENIKDLCSGPSKLCQALNIDLSVNGMDLTSRRRVWIEDSPPLNRTRLDVLATRRIGVTSAKNAKLRYVIPGHPFASGAKKLNRRSSSESQNGG